jgi:hypothetical protein
VTREAECGGEVHVLLHLLHLLRGRCALCVVVVGAEVEEGGRLAGRRVWQPEITRR